MNSHKSSSLVRLITGLMLFSLACGSLSNLGEAAIPSTPTPLWADKPYSTITPLISSQSNDLGNKVAVGVGDELILQSHHLSLEPLQTLDIWINDQPVPQADQPVEASFPPELAQLEVISGDEFVSASKITPLFPTSDWTVSLRWVGHTPGTYELKLQATDQANHIGEPVIQRIEVR